MRYFLIIALLLMGVSGFAQNKTASINNGNTYVDINFNASDTINESETYYIEISNFQHFQQLYDIWVDLDSVSGTPGVTTTVYGKKFSADSYVPIGVPVTWAGTVDTTFNYPVDTTKRYRYIKVEFVSDATDQQSLVSDVVVKTWNVGGDVSTSALTLSGNLAVGGTTTFTGAVTANGGITLGAGDDLIGSSTSDITFNTNKFTVAGASGNTVIAGTLNAAGVITLGNGLTIDNATNNALEFNENSDEFIWTFGSNTITASSGDVTLFDFGTINLATDAFDLSDGHILNVGNVSLDSIKADGSAIALGANAETVAINSSDWDISATGVATGFGNFTSDGKVTAADSLCLGKFRFVIRLDTLCSIVGTDTLRIHPAR